MLHSNIIGEGKPLLILHGFLGSGDNWKTFAKKWAEKGRSVHLLDARNHGKSFHNDEFSYEIMSQDVIDYADDQGIEKFDLLGHSMGGKTAQFVAQQFPERVDRLIVVDIASKAYPPHHTEILEALSEVDEQQFQSRKEAEEFLMPLFPEIGLRQFLLKNLERTDEGVLSVKCNLSLFRSHPERIGKALPEAPKIHTPALFIRGLESSYIEDVDLTSLQRQYPNFELVSIPNAGHWLHAEQPIAFGEAVAKFLNL